MELFMDLYVLLTILFFISINILFFCVGYLYCKASNTNMVDSKLFTKQSQTINKNKIDIDDKKIVIDIKTNNLEKKYDKITETKVSDDNITSSINKLKNMKG